MATPPIQFADGAAYEQGMGVWSRLAGQVFLEWLAPAPGQRWIDIGCGNGAFTEVLVQSCAPADVQAIDPSEGQLSFARTRPGTRGVSFHQGSAESLPFADGSFDAATMALVIFFVPDPVQGVAEMKRVVRPGGLLAAYAWDILEGGFPFEPILAEFRALGLQPAMPPSAPISRMPALRGLWTDSGLEDVQTREITVERSFASFDEFWGVNSGIGSISATISTFGQSELATFKERLRARLPTDRDGRIAYSGRANAVQGRVPA